MIQLYSVNFLLFIFMVIFLLQHPCSHAFYVPGVAPVEFAKGDVVDVKVIYCATILFFLEYNIFGKLFSFI